MVTRLFINGSVRLRNLGLLFLAVAPVMVVSCRTADICPPGMVFIEGQVAICGNANKPVYLEVASFYIDITEVTNEAYGKFIKAGGYEKPEYWSKEGWEWRKTDEKITARVCWSDPRFSDPQQPVLLVSYYEAEAYAKWAGKRLPTEVEWELASRGTDARYYPWGDEFNGLYANTEDYWYLTLGRHLRPDTKGDWKPEEARPTRVRSFEKDCSPFGCYDMCGNVSEWCQVSKEIPEFTTFPHDFSNPRYAAIRGGCWHTPGKEYATLFHRLFAPKNYRLDLTGFRCAMSYRSEK